MSLYTWGQRRVTAGGPPGKQTGALAREQRLWLRQSAGHRAPSIRTDHLCARGAWAWGPGRVRPCPSRPRGRGTHPTPASAPLVPGRPEGHRAAPHGQARLGHQHDGPLNGRSVCPTRATTEGSEHHPNCHRDGLGWDTLGTQTSTGQPQHHPARPRQARVAAASHV